MKKIFIIKSSSNIDKKEIIPISSSSSFKVWISSDSDTEEEENIDTDDPEGIDSDMLESLSSPVCKIWQKRKIHINTDFAVTEWMLCVILHIHKYEKYHSDSDHRKQVNNIINTFFHGVPEDEMSVTKDIFWTEYTFNLRTRSVHLMRMNLYGKLKTSNMVTVICGIKNIYFLAQRFLVLMHVESHQRFL